MPNLNYGKDLYEVYQNYMLIHENCEVDNFDSLDDKDKRAWEHIAIEWMKE